MMGDERTSEGLAVAYGGVVIDDHGRILLRKPANGFDGYVWTFPKGRPQSGETDEQAHALLERTHDVNREDIVEAISGNICRCTGYGQIIEAVEFAADRLRKSNVLRANKAAQDGNAPGHDAPEEGILEAAADAPGKGPK